MSRGLRYTFPQWCAANIEGRGAGAVRGWLAERGVLLSRQAVTKLLVRRPRDLRLATWQAICDATGRPLSAFIEYVPANDEPRTPVRVPATRAVTPQRTESLIDGRPRLPRADAR